MKFSYDSDVDALYLQLRTIEPGKIENRELGSGVTGDFASDGLLSGIEILNASRFWKMGRLDQEEFWLIMNASGR